MVTWPLEPGTASQARPSRCTKLQQKVASGTLSILAQDMVLTSWEGACSARYSGCGKGHAARDTAGAGGRVVKNRDVWDLIRVGTYA